MIRIVAGAARGRRLKVPPGDRTRPTSDRVREALFSSLESIFGSFVGLRVLDLYAGSGALGLEAISRGADYALLVESDPAAVRAIKANISATGAVHVDVQTGLVEHLLARPPDEPFDLVLADPPYAMDSGELTRVLAALGHGWLAPHALVIVERPRRSDPVVWSNGLEAERTRRYGETMLWYGRPAVDHLDEEVRVRRCVCPGSFDPVTNGHLDVIERAASLFDEVVVAVLVNVSKKGLFSVDERIEMLTDVTAGLGNVVVEKFEGLLVDFCRERDIPAIVRGLRAVTDFEYELSMAQMNYRLTNVETLFVATNPDYSFLSSSLVKEVASYGGDVSGLVPDQVLRRIVEQMRAT